MKQNDNARTVRIPQIADSRRSGEEAREVG